MNSYRIKGIAILGSVIIIIWSLLIWQYFNGGVPSHSFMASKDMPSISNWWGGLLLPLLTFFSLYRIEKRLIVKDEHQAGSQKKIKMVMILFAAGLLYAGTMAYCFVTDNSVINDILFKGLFFWALIFPLYRAEFFLGFVIGLTYTFGAVLPIFIASVFAVISFISHKYVYPLAIKVFENYTRKH